jgi:nucleoside-diphosphate-sugar epimerase
MKIVITSANSATGSMLIPVLQAAGHFITALVRKALILPADEVIADWMHAPAAAHALEVADVVIHLSGELNAKSLRIYEEANLETTRIVAEHARAGRIIYLSYPHASPTDRNYYLRTKGQAEEVLRQTKIPLVVFRCPVIIDAPEKASKIDVLFKARQGKPLLLPGSSWPVPVIGSGRQTMRPVYRGTVVEAIASAIGHGRPGVYELSGVDEMTIDAFIRLANPSGVRLLHIPGWLAMLMSRMLPDLSSTFVDMMLHHTGSVYDPATYREFGVGPVSVVGMWRRSTGS